MPCGNKIPVLAFTESHVPYMNLDMHSDLSIKFCTEIDHFLEQALSSDFSGVILEMKKVMSTPARDRDKIFSLAADKPLLRTRAKSSKAVLVDDPVRFRADCRKNEKGQIRVHERANVELQIQVSHEDDHVMAEEFLAVVINISKSGCFFRTTTDLSANHFVHLRFHDISNKLPICGAIRWQTTPKNGIYGFGVHFISIKKDQLSELEKSHIIPNLPSCK